MSPTRIELLKVLQDHRVDIQEKLNYIRRLKDLGEAEAEQEALNMIAEIKERYPLPTREEFLREYDASRDWWGLDSHKRIYWSDLKGVLNDAVRYGCMNIAEAIAPLYVFENPAEVLTVETDAETRDRLFGVQNIRESSFYESRPYCIKSTPDKKDTVIAYYASIQPHVLRKFYALLESRGVSKERLIRELHRKQKDEESGDPILIRCIMDAEAVGLSSTGKELIRLSMPQALLGNEDAPYLSENWKAGHLLSMLRMFGWDLYIDGINNSLGAVGYWYINSEIPEHAAGKGDIYLNGKLIKDED